MLFYSIRYFCEFWFSILPISGGIQDYTILATVKSKPSAASFEYDNRLQSIDYPYTDWAGQMLHLSAKL